MKAFKTNKYLSARHLQGYLNEHLNDLFKAKIQKDIAMQITLTGEHTIEIGQPQFYDSFLYKMIVKGDELQLIKSEHYVDDVYNLALEDIVLNLIESYIGQENIVSVFGEISG
ncbi:hypothetical protein BEL04_02085 [Mucilaginibacter sp. PPCGB 2223]|uniref:hypothetical protein n=1 Tax=Mucilaginibacter sp. PPCGB 2223 TaxID=1886027 RepID=UPI000826BC65|nr:hypothetical protein [Mucilaginibacter sp. PPCGB 2223]OCX53126.1 hypothetical protein BEL04_02085 [Mucilaginibacter sp. PPCGB 2223]